MIPTTETTRAGRATLPHPGEGPRRMVGGGGS